MQRWISRSRLTSKVCFSNLESLIQFLTFLLFLGAKLLLLNAFLEDYALFSNLEMPDIGHVRARNFEYGGDMHFVNAKVGKMAKFKREGELVRDADIRKGEEVDVVFTAMLRLAPLKDDEEGYAAEARWYLTVAHVKAFEKKAAAEPKGADNREFIL